MLDKEKLMIELRFFLSAMALLTRLPVGKWSDHSENNLILSSVYYPFVGVVIGLLCGIAFLTISQFWPQDIAIIIALLVGTLSTGAFHEDGFADVLDSTGGYDLQKKFLIMKDSHLGTFAVCGLAFLLLVKFFALKSAINNEYHPLVLFIVAHGASRWVCLPLLFNNHYISPSSSFGHSIIIKLTDRKRFWISTAICLAALIYLAESKSILIIIAMLFTLMTTQYYYRKTFNGISGDCLGATNQLTEVIVFMMFAIVTN